MTNRQRRTALAVAALGAALALGACAGDDELAATETELNDDERLAQLEAQLDELRSDDEDGSTDSDTDGENGEDPDDGSQLASAGEPDGPRAVEVGETFVNTSEALTVTVDRVVIHDHYIEVEVTAYNDHPEVEFALWNGTNVGMPMLFDEQDRRFGYQHPAGYSSGQRVEALPGQRLDAVMVFAGALDPQAQSLTLRFRNLVLEDWELTVPVGQVQP